MNTLKLLAYAALILLAVTTAMPTPVTAAG